MLTSPAPQATPITREGLRALHAELDQLRGPFDSSRLGHLDTEFEARAARDARVAELEAILATVQVADPPTDGTAGVGSMLRAQISGCDGPCWYRLVGPLESDSASRAISIDSPIGAAVLGRRAGETVEVSTPGGHRHVAILQVGGYR
jgi:transcription elongation factor GreA